MMPQIKRVMIGSTLDLVDERNTACNACRQSGTFPESTEVWTAETGETLDLSLRKVRECEVYLCIIGYRYGTLPKNDNRSYTEMELAEALADKKRAVLVFVRKRQVLDLSNLDLEEFKLRQAFVRRIKDGTYGGIYARDFDSMDDLRAEIVVALAALASRQATKETPNPEGRARTQKRFIRNEYALLDSREAEGREDSYNELDEWMSSDDRPVCVIEAIGGMGKSALAWSWARRWQKRNPTSSFTWYGLDGGSVGYLDFLQGYVSSFCGIAANKAETMGNEELERAIITQMQDEPSLVVLDGFERQLRAYDTFDPGRLDDTRIGQLSVDVESRAHPSLADPAGDVSRRLATNPNMGKFLQRLREMSGPSRILITSRLLPKDLEMRSGGAHARVKHLILEGLSVQGARSLWNTMRVKSSEKALARLVRNTGGYPLVLCTLAGKIGKEQLERSYDDWLNEHPHAGIFAPELTADQGRSQVLSRALEGLPDRELDLIRFLAAFPHEPSLKFVRDYFLDTGSHRYDSRFDDLEGLVAPTPAAGMTADDLNSAIRSLVDRRLIGLSAETANFEMHPVVRGIVWSQMTASDQLLTMEAIEQHLEAMPSGALFPGEPRSVDDLTLPIQLFHSLMSQRKYFEAAEFYIVRLKPLLKRLDADQTMKEMVDLFFKTKDKKITLPLQIYFNPKISNEKLALHDISNQSGALHELYGDLSVASAINELHKTTCHDPVCRSKQIDILFELGQLAESEDVLIECMGNLSKYLSKQGRFEEDQATYSLWRMLAAIRTYASRKCLVRVYQLVHEKITKLEDRVGYSIFSGTGMTAEDISIHRICAAGQYAMDLKDLERAEQCANELLAVAGRNGRRSTLRTAYMSMGKVKLEKSDYRAAGVQFQRAIETASEEAFTIASLDAQVGLAEAEMGSGQLDVADEILDLAATMASDRNHYATLAEVRLAQARLAQARAQPEAEGRALLGAVECFSSGRQLVRGYKIPETAISELRRGGWMADEDIAAFGPSDGVVMTELDVERLVAPRARK
jgi:tetratricopeptide (TPR) repeat protein